MSQEQVKNNTPEEKSEKIFNSENLVGKKHEDQLLEFDTALNQLDSMSNELESALGQAELDRLGKNEVIKNTSLFDRFKLGAHELFKNKEGYKEQLSIMAKEMALDNLDKLERGLGADLLKTKEDMEAHEKNSQQNLKIITDLPGMDPEKIKLHEEKIQTETESMRVNKELKEIELKNKISEHPVFKKKESLDKSIGEYNQISLDLSFRKQILGQNIMKYESAYKKISGENASSQEIKVDIMDKLKELKEQYQEIQERQEKVQGRMDVLITEKQDIDPFVNRLNNLGKTKAEKLAEAKDQLRKKAEAAKGNKDDKSPPTNQGTRYYQAAPKTSPESHSNYEDINENDKEEEEVEKNNHLSLDIDPDEIADRVIASENWVRSNADRGIASATENHKEQATEESLEEETNEENLEDRLKKYLQNARQWTSDIKIAAPDLVGEEIFEELNQKTKFGNIDGLTVMNVLAQFLNKAGKIKDINQINTKVREIMEKIYASKK